MDNAYYFTMPVNVYRNKSGQWIQPPAYWILMVYEDDKGIHYEFGRFMCDI